MVLTVALIAEVTLVYTLSVVLSGILTVTSKLQDSPVPKLAPLKEIFVVPEIVPVLLQGVEGSVPVTESPETTLLRECEN